jgi:oxaloacetate decarboxylase alpha subunit
MLSNFRKQLSETNQLDLLPEVLKEVELVRKDIGYPPLVTPSSQMVGAQAVLNVMTKERYKMVTNEIKNYLRGYYGRPPGEIDEDFRKKIIGDDEVISVRPAETMEPGFEKAKKEIAKYMEREEDVLSYAAFPNVAEEFFKQRQTAKYKVNFDEIEKQEEEEGIEGVHPI